MEAANGCAQNGYKTVENAVVAIDQSPVSRLGEQALINSPKIQIVPMPCSSNQMECDCTYSYQHC